MSEDHLKACIVTLAELHGWMVYTIRRSDLARVQGRRRTGIGFPDLVLVHPTLRRVQVVELKSASGVLTKAQGRWLAALHDAQSLEVAVWRPAQWLDGTIEGALRHTPPSAGALRAAEQSRGGPGEAGGPGGGGGEGTPAGRP